MGGSPRCATRGGGAPPERTAVAVYPDPATLALASATLIVEVARRAAKVRGRFTLALAGGSTPEPVYALLGQSPFADFMPWEQTHIFWTDERCVSPEDLRSNERMAREAFLDRVSLAPDKVHPIRCAAGGVMSRALQTRAEQEAAQRAAAKYEDLLRRYFPPASGSTGPGADDLGHPDAHPHTALDMVLLGLGEDGHTASLFPASEGSGETRRSTTAVFVDAAPGEGATAGGRGLWRVTLTASFINRAALVVFLVSGPAKAPIVREVLEGPLDVHRLPAQLIRPECGTLRWHLDDGAAALLSPGRRGW